MTIKIEKVIYQLVLYMPTIIYKIQPSTVSDASVFCAIIGENVAKMLKMCFWIQFSDWILHCSSQHLPLSSAHFPAAPTIKVATI